MTTADAYDAVVVGGGFYVTTSQFGPNFYLGNNAHADGTAQSLRVGRGSAEYERQDAVELAEHALGRRLTPAEVSQYWTDRALTFMTWTVDDEKDMAAMCEAGVDSICSNFPDLVVKVVRQQSRALPRR